MQTTIRYYIVHPKSLRMLIICFVIAILLNVANFVVYFIHYNKFQMIKINKVTRLMSLKFNQEGTNKNWKMLNTMVVCGDNLTDCLNESFIEPSNTTETTEKALHYYVEDVGTRNTRTFCPKIPPGLGPVKFDRSFIQLNDIEEMFSYLKPGGLFKPTHCMPRQNVAIIISMQDFNRAWKNYIGTFLYYIHPFLMKQLAEYQIFVIVQGNPTEPYARGKLLNTGFMEAQRFRRYGWDCLIFHDAHLIPIDTRNLYRCGERAKHLYVQPGKLKKFGGAVAITPSLFKKLNGFSNLDWHNDGDYVNMYRS